MIPSWSWGTGINRHYVWDPPYIPIFLKRVGTWQTRYLSYPDSLLVVLHFVHLKKVIVEWIVSSAASTFQVSLSVFPHFSQTIWIVGSSLSIASWLWSTTAISAILPCCRLTFFIDSFCSIGFWYLHFGHLSVEEPFFVVWSIDPHFGQKSIVFTCVKAFLTKMIFMCCDFYVTNPSINVLFGAIELSIEWRPHLHFPFYKIISWFYGIGLVFSFFRFSSSKQWSLQRSSWIP